MWSEKLIPSHYVQSESQWPSGLRRRFAAARLLRLWVRIPQGAWMSVCFECCLSSGRGLCDGLITRPGESYRLWCVVVCDLETSWMRRPWPTGGCCAKRKKKEGYVRSCPEYALCRLVVGCITFARVGSVSLTRKQVPSVLQQKHHTN